jgi:hypothetical protein
LAAGVYLKVLVTVAVAWDSRAAEVSPMEIAKATM